MDLNYVSSDVLNPYDKKYDGWFVYLRNDYNEFKKGLYFGGDDGWERLTNDELSGLNLKNIPLPLENVQVYNYTGDEYVYLPVNFDDIEKFVNIYNNTHSDAGIYKVSVSLKYDEWTWEDGTSEAKEFEFVINPEHVSSATVKLSKNTCEYGEEIPYVVDILYQNKVLVKGKDYEVVYPELGDNVITINFINNYTGIIKKTFNLLPKKIEKPILTNNIFQYTGENVIVYPDNWESIKQYCEISNNIGKEAGEYYMLISLKNDKNYCWKEDGSNLPVEKLFIIGSVEIPVPIWDYDYLYEVDYNGTQHVFHPLNWDDMKDFVSISGNQNTNAGDYEIILSLKGDNIKWSDNTTDDKVKSYKINKLIVDTPVWSNVNAGYYTGKSYTYTPLNWDSISEFAIISNNVQVNAGVYEAIVSLKDKVNYAWTNSAGIINSNDIISEFEILKASGFFTTGPYIHGNFYVDDNIYCVATYIDNTCELTYEWYRNTISSLNGATFITSSKSNEYKILKEDVGHFLICNVVATSTGVSNYTGGEASSTSRLKVSKAIVYNVLDFEPKIYEDSIPSTQTTYTLPDVTRLSYDDGSILEYNIVSGNDVAELWDIHNGILIIKGIGDVIVEVTIRNSKNYIYSPDTIRFVLHVYSDDIVLWGLYDKENETPEDKTLYEGLIPENAQRAILKENEKGIHSFMFRKQFPFRKFDGEEQKYYGWYVLIPVDKNLIEVDENGGNTMNVEELKLKNEDGTDLIITTSENVKYRVYGKFNVAKTSDNWMLHILFKNNQL